ncbi:hypothetical protein oki101_15010 [Helicobacter pylori]
MGSMSKDYQNTMLLLAKERLLFLEQDLKTKEEEFKRAKESYFKALESHKETFSLKENQDLLKQNKQFSKLSKDIVYICNEIIGANRFLTHYDISQLQKVLEHAKDTKLEQKEIQAITKEPNNDEPWIEFAKLEQARATQEPHAKEEPKKTSHPDEPWLDYDPKTHAGLKERQENQEKTPSKGNDEPWIEFAKLEQARAKAHYQAIVEKEKAKQLVKEPKKTLHTNELVYDPKTHAGLRKR